MRADRGLRPAGAAARAGVVAEVAEVDAGRSRRRRRSGGSAWSRRRGARAAVGAARVLDAEVDGVGRVAAEVGDQRVVGVEDQAGGCAGRRARPSGRRSSRARRSGRAGRGRGCRAGSPGAASCSTTGTSQNSSTSNRPRSAAGRRASVPASSSVEAIPPAMLAPALLWTTLSAGALEDAGDHRRRRRLAVGRRDHHAAAGRGRRPAGAIAPRVEAQEDAAGQARAAAAAAGGRGLPAARASARLSAAGSDQPPARTSTRTGRRHGSDRHRQLADRVAVGVHGERAVGADPHRPAPRRTWTFGSWTWRALEDLGELGEEAQAADVLGHDDVEQAVVERGVGGDAHTAAVGARVGGRDDAVAAVASARCRRRRS